MLSVNEGVHIYDAEREYFVVFCLDTKDQPTNINICHIGTLNTSLVSPMEVLKPAILSNAASIILKDGKPIWMNELHGKISSY